MPKPEVGGLWHRKTPFGVTIITVVRPKDGVLVFRENGGWSEVVDDGFWIVDLEETWTGSSKEFHKMYMIALWDALKEDMDVKCLTDDLSVLPTPVNQPVSRSVGDLCRGSQSNSQ